MSDVNELPDYDYDEDNREEAKNGAQDADGKKYVKLLFPSYINLSFSERANDQTLNRPLII